MQTENKVSANAFDIEVQKTSLLESAERDLLDNSGVLVSERLFQRIADDGLLGTKIVFSSWKIPILKTVASKTIYVWPAMLQDRDFLLPPYAAKSDNRG